MADRLMGKVAVITGGNSGIGETTGHVFAREGAKVILMARRAEQGQAVAAAIRDAGGEATFIPCDVGDDESVRSAVAQAAVSTAPSTCCSTTPAAAAAVSFPTSPTANGIASSTPT